MAEYKFGQLIQEEEEKTLQPQQEETRQQSYEFGKPLDLFKNDQLVEESKSRWAKTPDYLREGGINLFESITRAPQGYLNSVRAQAYDDLLTEFRAEFDEDKDTSALLNQISKDKGVVYDYIRSGIEQDIGLKESFFGSGAISFQEKSPEELIRIQDELASQAQEWRAGWDKEIKEYQRQQSKRYREAGFDRTDADIASGVTSVGLMVPSLALAYGTRNPKLLNTSLPMFGGLSYVETFEDSISRGLSVKDATKNAQIQAASEILTEAGSNFFISNGLKRFLKGSNKDAIKDILKNGAASFISDAGFEQINTLIQSGSNAYFDIQDELRVAFDNKDNPFYEGPSVLDLVTENAKSTAIATAVAGGTFTGINSAIQLTPEVKKIIKNRGEQEGGQIYNELGNLVTNKDLNKIAYDKAAARLNSDEFANNKSVDPTDIIAEELLKVQYVGKIETVEQEAADVTPIESAQSELNNINSEIERLNAPETFESYELIENETERRAKIQEDSNREKQLKLRQTALDNAIKYLTRGEGKNLTFTAQQIEELIQAEIESAELQAVDPTTLTDIEKQRQSNLLKANRERINQARNLGQEEVTLRDEVQSKFERAQDKKPAYAFGQLEQSSQPLKKEPGELTSEIDLDLDEGMSSRVENTQFKIQSSIPKESTPLNIDRIESDNYSEEELSIVKNYVINSREFNPDNLKGIPARFADNNIYRIRDFNDDEKTNAAKSFIDLREAGMPIDIFSDLQFMGAHVKDDRFKTFNPAYGVYIPELAGITMSPVSGISNLGFKNVLGSKIHARDTMIHELGHHIDFTIGRDLSKSSSIYTPITDRSPLFDLPKVEIINNKVVIDENTGGVVLREALNLYQKAMASDPNSYYNGAFLSYPFNEFLSSGDFITLAQGRMIKAEVFAQMHNLYYTNRQLMESLTPETFKLFEAINDGISVDGITAKNQNVSRIFQTPDSQRGVALSGREQFIEEDQPISTAEQAGRGVEEPARPEDRDDIRSEIPKITGAPRGVDTNRKVGALRRKIKKLVQAGENNRFWYEESSKAILDITQGNIEDADKLAQAIAITSPRTNVDVNFTFALQAYYQWKSGSPIETGIYPAQMGPKLEKAFAGEDWEGKKTNNFYNNLMRVIDPSKAQGVTVDMWMARMFGYTKPAGEEQLALGPAQYDFVAKEIQKITEELGWEPQQVQAAAWVAEKSRAEGTELEDAGFSYATAAAKNLVQISTETIPGRTNNHMSEMLNAPYEQVQEYHVNAAAAILDNDGADIIAKRLDLLSPGIFEAPGYFEEKLSPGSQTEVVAPQERKTKELEIQKDAEDLIKAYAAVYGTLFKQDAVGYHKPFYKKSIAKSKRNLHEIRIGRAVTNEEIVALANSMAQISGKDYLNPIPTPTGVRFINFAEGDGINNIKFAKLVDQVIDDVKLADNVEVVEAAAALGYLENNWSESKNGEDYTQISLSDRPDLQERVRDIVRELQPRLDEVDQSFSEKYGWTRDESINSDFRQPEQIASKIEEPEGPSLSESEIKVFNFIKNMGVRVTVSDIQRSFKIGFNETKGIVEKLKKENLLDEQLITPPYKYTVLSGQVPAYTISEYGITKVEEFGNLDFSGVDQSFEPVKPPAPPGKPPSENYSWTSGDELNSDLALQWTLTKFQNMYNRQVVIEEVIEDKFQQGILKDMDLSVVDDLDLMKSIIGDQQLKSTEEIEAMLEKMFNLSDNKYSNINGLLYNLHAPERNKFIYEKFQKKLDDAIEKYGPNPTPAQKGQITRLTNLAKPFKNNGSGIDTEEAIKTLREKFGIEYNKDTDTATPINKKGEQYLEVADLAQQFIKNTREIYQKAGLVSQENLDDWDERYKYYVPLSGFAADTNVDGKPNSKGKGLSVHGLEVPKAKGRTSMAGDPIIQMYKQRENAIVRQEKNKVVKKLADQARTFINPEVYEVVDKIPTKAKYKPEWDPIKQEAYVFFKEDGKQKAVVIRDERLARAFQHLDVEGLNVVLATIAKATRLMSVLNTGYNPDFVIPNFSRDAFAATAGAIGEQDVKGGRIYKSKIVLKSLKGVFPRIAELYTYYRKGPEFIKDPVQREIAKKYHEMGSKTSYFEFLDTDKLTKNFTALEKYRTGKISARDFKRYTLDLVGDINNVIENGIRFSQFTEFVKERGGLEAITPANMKRAAVQAKNSSINFDRRGEWGAQIGALLMFFNPAIQGSVQFMRGQNIFTARGRKRLSPKKMGFTALGGASIGMLYTLYNLMITAEDEDGEPVYNKISDHEKARNMLLLMPDEISMKSGEGFKIEKFGETKKYITSGDKPFAISIPLAYGYNVNFNLGRLFIETQAHILFPDKFKNPITTVEKAGFELADAFVTSFSPIAGVTTEKTGIDGLVNRSRSLLPSVVFRPLADIAANETFFGGPITRPDMPYGPKRPGFTKALPRTNEFYVALTEELNSLTGGNDYTSGWIDLDPNQLKYFVDYHAGGTGRTIERGVTLPGKIEKGMVDREDVPIQRSFTAEPQEFMNGRIFYARKDEIIELLDEYKNLSGKEKLDFERNNNMNIVKLGDWKSPTMKKRERGKSERYKEATKPKLVKALDKLAKLRDKEDTALNLYKERDPDRYDELMEKYREEEQEIYLEFNKFYNQAKNK